MSLPNSSKKGFRAMNKCGICHCIIIAQAHRVVCYSCEDDEDRSLALYVEYDADNQRWFLDGI